MPLGSVGAAPGRMLCAKPSSQGWEPLRMLPTARSSWVLSGAGPNMWVAATSFHLSLSPRTFYPHMTPCNHTKMASKFQEFEKGRVGRVPEEDTSRSGLQLPEQLTEP